MFLVGTHKFLITQQRQIPKFFFFLNMTRPNNHVLFKNDQIYVYYAFVNITHYISHCFTSFTLGVVIKFLLYHRLIAVMGPQCVLQRLNILLLLPFSVSAFHPLFASEYILRKHKQQQKILLKGSKILETLESIHSLSPIISRIYGFS